ncbi:MAG: hypothetical protein IJG45_03650 [Oscillospiraceae bacterium]|nr:hypothetical protein [Oscillospiraceae bacterium]
MKKYHLNRMLALALTVAMLLSVGFVLPVAADAPIELGYLHASDGTTQNADSGEITLNCDNPYGTAFEWKNLIAESADCVQFIRSGDDTVYDIGVFTEHNTTDGILISHNGTELVFRNGGWFLHAANQSNTTPLAYGDTIVVGGNFTYNGTVFHVSTTYITKDADGYIHCSDTFETGSFTPTATTDGFLLAAEYKCYTETWAQFYADDAANVKLFRNGNVYNIGALTEYGTTDGILVSRNGNQLFLRNSQWNLNCTGISGLSPMTAGDVIYIGGTFTTSNGQTLHVKPTYMYMDSQSNLTTSDAFSVGTLSADSSHPAMTSDGSIYGIAEGGYAGNWQEYKAESMDCVKLRKSGSDTDVPIGIPGSQNIMRKRGDNVFCIISSQYYLNLAGQGSLTPFAEGDVMIVEGNFTGVSDGITAHIEKTYITIENGNLVFSTTDPADAPTPSVIQAGVMAIDSNNTSLTSGSFYFTMADNAIPYDAGWANEFYATSADCVKLIRGGGTEADAISIAQTTPGRAPFIKYGQTGYYFNGSDAWHIGNNAPLQNGDILIVGGEFTNGTTTFEVSKSVIVIGSDGSLTFTNAVPAGPIQAGVMVAGSNTSLNNGGFYFSMADNDIPYTDGDWTNEFYATSADCIKLIRGGGSAVSIAQTTAGRAPFIKYGKNSYYFNGSDAWHIGNSAPLRNGDILIVEGEFTNGTTNFVVSRSVITIGSNGTVSFGTTIPTVISGGLLSADSNNGSLLNSGSFYFAMAANDLPADGTWATRYYPSSASCIKLTHNGTTTNIGNVNAGTLLKLDTTRYYLALDAWAYPTVPQPGDIVTIEGDFVLNDATLRITKTYIAVNWDGSLTFTSTQPTAPVKPFADTQAYPVAIWNGSFHNFSMQQMYDLRMAGINEIIGITPYWLGSSDTERNNNMNTLLKYAAIYGITVYPSLDVFDSSGNASMWDGTTVPGYNTQHAAIGGFLIKDEPTLSEINTLGTLKTAFDANSAFAGKVFYVNLHPQSSTSNIVGSSYETYVNNFISTVDPDVIGVDVYPINSSGAARKIYFSNLAMLATKAKQNGSTLQYTMLSCGHSSGSSTYTAPSTALMRWQTDVALAFGVSGLAHYLYTSHASGYDTMANTSGAITNQTLYNNIATAGSEHLAWLDTYSEYIWQGTAAVNNDSNRMITRMGEYASSLPSGTTVSSTGDVLVGIFDKNGEKAYMITNAGASSLQAADPLDRETVSGFYNFSMSAVTVTLGLTGVDWIEVISEGTTSYIAKSNGSFTIPVAAYEGVFVKPHTHVYENGVCVCGDATLRILSASLRLDEDIDVIYTVSVPTGYTNPYMVVNGTTISSSEASGGNRLFTYTGITPQRMSDNISATLYATKNGTTESVSVAEYSVKQYCTNLLNSNPSAQLRTLLSDLLTYGAAAQTYTNYNTANLATSGLTLTPSTFSAISGKNVTFTGTADANTDWIAATLVLGNNVATRFYFTTDDISKINIDITINGDTETLDEGFVSVGNGKYYIDFFGIEATQFDDTITATFYVNGVETGRTIGYSVNTYICGTQNSTNATLRALVRALYNYGASAAAYAQNQ